MTKRKVIIRSCDEYRQPLIKQIIREGIEELGEEPKGRILIKPNVVTANTQYIHHSYTAPPMAEAMVNVLRETGAGGEITIGESGAIGMPTRLFFADSGYSKMARRLGVPLRNFNEEKTIEVKLSRAKWHKTFLAAKSLYEADYKIWMPKLKYHIVAQITNALKLNIGILTHKERFLYHDDRLNEKIVDLLEFGYPNLIVTDAVMIGHGFESSPYPFHLGAILISNDPLAADMVAARILNYQPEEVMHLVEARDRGYGSLNFDDIDVTGDISIEQLSEKTRAIESAFQDLQKLKTPVRFYEGVNPKTGNICYGGCICSIKGVLGTAEKKYPGNLAGAKPGAIVMGHYKGDVIHPGQPVALIGTCADVEGKFECGKIIRIKGCPVKVRDLAVVLLHKFGMKSPAFDPANIAKMLYYSGIETCSKVGMPSQAGVGRFKV
ncbi:MAG: DUF362 domain-containing protein [Candidatus Lindowbacteria bacterium]|nr:DUF362 domain-containing protein [Candidatus Lindowbacteria bacterium]